MKYRCVVCLGAVNISVIVDARTIYNIIHTIVDRDDVQADISKSI